MHKLILAYGKSLFYFTSLFSSLTGSYEEIYSNATSVLDGFLVNSFGS